MSTLHKVSGPGGDSLPPSTLPLSLPASFFFSPLVSLSLSSSSLHFKFCWLDCWHAEAIYTRNSDLQKKLERTVRIDDIRTDNLLILGNSSGTHLTFIFAGSRIKCPRVYRNLLRLKQFQAVFTSKQTNSCDAKKPQESRFQSVKTKMFCNAWKTSSG